MHGNYHSISRFELVSLLVPQQPVELKVIYDTPGSETLTATIFRGHIEKLGADRLTLVLDPVVTAFYQMLKAGLVVTLLSGQAHGGYAFKTRIIHSDSVTRRISLELPTLTWTEERRDDPRIPITVPAIYRLLRYRNLDLKLSTSKVGVGSTDNLSSKGLSLITELSLPVGLTLALEFELEQRPFATTGRVQRTCPLLNDRPVFSTGIMLLDPSPVLQELLTETLQRNNLFSQQRLLM